MRCPPPTDGAAPAGARGQGARRGRSVRAGSGSEAREESPAATAALPSPPAPGPCPRVSSLQGLPATPATPSWARLVSGGAAARVLAQQAQEQVLQLHGDGGARRVGHLRRRHGVVQVQHALALWCGGAKAANRRERRRAGGAHAGPRSPELLLPARPGRRCAGTRAQPLLPCLRPTRLEGQLSVDEVVERHPQRPHVGLPPAVALARAHLGRCGGAQQGAGRGSGGLRRHAARPSCDPCPSDAPCHAAPRAPRYAGVPSVRSNTSRRPKNWLWPAARRPGAA